MNEAAPPDVATLTSGPVGALSVSSTRTTELVRFPVTAFAELQRHVSRIPVSGSGPRATNVEPRAVKVASPPISTTATAAMFPVGLATTRLFRTVTALLVPPSKLPMLIPKLATRIVLRATSA